MISRKFHKQVCNHRKFREITQIHESIITGLERIMDKPWHICASNAVTGEGLHEGVEWLTAQIKDLMDNKR